MNAEGVRIEYVQNGFPLPITSEEFVVIFNASKNTFDLKGWRLVYLDVSSGEVLHTHYFNHLRGSFAPGERLCLLSGIGINRFQS